MSRWLFGCLVLVGMVWIHLEPRTGLLDNQVALCSHTHHQVAADKKNMTAVA